MSDLNEFEEKMKKTISVYNENLSEIRAGRANPAILNKIKVSYYGVETPINQVAGISVPEARMIVIQPWDASILKEIEKAYNSLVNVTVHDEWIGRCKEILGINN